MNRLSETHFEVFATSYAKTSFIHSFEATPPPGGALTPIQESRHVAATPSLQWQIKMDPAGREGG